MASKARKRKHDRKEEAMVVEPTDLMQQRYEFTRGGMSHIKLTPIQVMLVDGRLTRLQFDGLKKFGDMVAEIERSPIKDSIAKLAEARGGTRVTEPLPMVSEYRPFAKALGAFEDIARAIAYEDETISSYAIRIHGGIEREREGPSGKIVKWIEPRRKHYDQCLWEIREAGNILAQMT